MLTPNTIPTILVVGTIAVSAINLMLRLNVARHRRFAISAAILTRLYLLGVYLWVHTTQPQLSHYAFFVRMGIVLVFGIDAFMGIAAYLQRHRALKENIREWERLLEYRKQNSI